MDRIDKHGFSIKIGKLTVKLIWVSDYNPSIPHLLIKSSIRSQICELKNYYVCRYGN